MKTTTTPPDSHGELVEFSEIPTTTPPAASASRPLTTAEVKLVTAARSLGQYSAGPDHGTIYHTMDGDIVLDKNGNAVVSASASRHTVKGLYSTSYGNLVALENGAKVVHFEHVGGRRGSDLAADVAAKFNACAGMVNPAAETAELRRKSAMADELAKELEVMTDYLEACHSSVGLIGYINAARGALAKFNAQS